MKQKIKGLLIGCAFGDAYGMPTEFMTRSQIKDKYGVISELMPSHGNMIDSRFKPAGKVTDDTINTLMIFKMLCNNKGRINVDNYLSALKAWINTDPLAKQVTGPSTSRALRAIKNGVDISESGKLGTTNGAAMKIAPIGIFNDYRSLNELVEQVYQICLPTHNTNIAITGATIIASLSSFLLREDLNWNKVFKLIDDAINISQEYGNNLPSASLKYRINLALKIARISRSDEEFLNDIYNKIGSGMETIETIPSAIAIFYYGKADPLKTAQLSASLGGDTDTIGSISTCLAGTCNSYFDNKIVKQLEFINGISFDQLIEKMKI